MKINYQNLTGLLQLLQVQGMMSQEELFLALKLKEEHFEFAPQLNIADSIHYHIHAPDVEKLPHDLFLQNGGKVENEKGGYIKYRFPGGINLIFSHIAVAQKELGRGSMDNFYLDHIGIDIRSEEKQAYIVFQQIPSIAAEHDYIFKRQGDGIEAVKCCHMQVKEKYWVDAGKDINYEFAFGPLLIHDNGFGIDLRPANPFNKPMEEGKTACCEQSKPTRGIFIK